MSWLDTLLRSSVLEMVGIWFAIGVALVSMFIVSKRFARTQHEVERLQRELVVFAESSTRVAETLDQLLQGNVVATRVGHTSRRYLLSEAQEGLRLGESLDALAERLGLSHDEVQLLQSTHRPRASQRAA